MSEYYYHVKYKIFPNEEQQLIINRMINLYRFVYNWAISEEQTIYQQYLDGLNDKQFYSEFDLFVRFTKFRNDPSKTWLKKITIGSARGAIKDAVNAYRMFFNGYNSKPGFKKKNKSSKICKLRGDKFYIENSGVRIDGLKRFDKIDLGRNITEFDKSNKYYSPMIMQNKIGEYFITFAIKKEQVNLQIPKSEPVGIDIGVTNTYSLSTGEQFIQPDISKYQHRLKILHRRVTRDINRRFNEAVRTKTKYDDIPKSKRAIKRELQFCKCNKKIHDIHTTFYQQITSLITKRNPEAVIMETFKVNNVINNRSYMRKIMKDTYFYTMITMMKNKCFQYNIPFYQVPENYPSSQICSNCGTIKNIGSNHIYYCNNCGIHIDRDINAAINLKNCASLFY